MFCPNCGKKLDRDEKFCSICGAKVEQFYNQNLDKPKENKRSIWENFCLIISIISFIVALYSCGVTFVFIFFGSLLCGKAFHIISSSDGPIPVCENIFATDMVWVLVVGIISILIGIIFMNLGKSKGK